MFLIILNAILLLIKLSNSHFPPSNIQKHCILIGYVAKDEGFDKDGLIKFVYLKLYFFSQPLYNIF